MIDLRVAVAVDLLQVRTLGKSPINAGYLRLTGPGLGGASLVTFNDIAALDVIVVAADQIDALMPDFPVGVALRTIEVRSLDFTGRASANLDFTIQLATPAVQGLAKMVQSFLCLLLSTPGSDAFHQEEGGGLGQMLGRGVNPDDRASFVTPIVASVGRVREQMQRSQTATRLPLDERLKDAVVQSVQFDRARNAIQIELSLASMAGHAASARFGVPSPVT